MLIMSRLGVRLIRICCISFCHLILVARFRQPCIHIVADNVHCRSFLHASETLHAILLRLEVCFLPDHSGSHGGILGNSTRDTGV